MPNPKLRKFHRISAHPPHFGACLLTAVVALALAPGHVSAQSMASSEKSAQPPLPLPDGLVLPPTDFVDIAGEAGLSLGRDPAMPGGMTYLTETTGGGVALIDFDNDGLLDIFFVGTVNSAANATATPHRLYHNNGNLRFKDVSSETGHRNTGWGQGVCAGDFDQDGFVDLFVTHWGPDSLLRNLGGTGFADEAGERGVAGRPDRWSTGCSFLDFDRDGDLDLFVAHYVDFDRATTPLPGEASQCEWKGAPIPCGPRGLAAESMSLFANDGKGHFEDVSQASGVAAAKRYHGLGVISTDFDNDGWLDIFVACDSTANLLFRNVGDGTFEEIGLFSGAAYNEDGHEQAGMGVAAADYDGDGRSDLFVTNFAADTNTLYRNTGGGIFRDATVMAGLATATAHVGWGADFLDFDLDGWPDIFVANGHVAPSVDNADIGETFAQPRLLFWNRGDGKFHPISARAGSAFGTLRASRGSATGDLDNDGDQEIVVVNIDRTPSLLQDRAEHSANWLVVRATTESGSDAIGARVTVRADGFQRTAAVRSGGGYLSQGDLRVHFGLGALRSVEIEILWPSGHASQAGDFEANQIVTISEPPQSRTDSAP